MSRATIAVSLDPRTVKQVRAEAKRQRRPISWVVQDLLTRGFASAKSEAAHARSVIASPSTALDKGR